MKSKILFWSSFTTSFLLYITLLALYLPRIRVFGTFVPVDASLYQILLKNTSTLLDHV